MPDYECHPLWHYKNNNVGEINPESLPISSKLISMLSAWAAEYDSTLNQESPVESGFANKESEEVFVAKGCEIASMLKKELKTVEVIYYDISHERETII